MASGVWVFAEQRGGELRKVTHELLSVGRRFADSLGQELVAVLLGKDVRGLVDGIAAYGTDRILVADDPRLDRYTTGAYTSVVADLIRRYTPEAFFLGNTAVGKDLAPRVAERVKAGLNTDCTAVELVEGKFVFTRPIYAGKAITTVECIAARPVMVTIRPNVLGNKGPAGDKGATVEEVEVRLEPESLRTIVREVLQKATGRVELTEADIIISGGRGMKGPENFKLLEEMADVLGASVGASRAAVDAGGGNTSIRWGRRARRYPPVCTLPAVFPERSSTWLGCPLPGISWPLTRTLRPISSKWQTMALLMTCSRWCLC